MSARCASPTAITDVHYVLHAPQGDTYADLLFTMIERRATRARQSPTRHSRHATSAATPPTLFKDHLRDRVRSLSPGR
jgi:light-independent protochlorophyllide reductase subunit B